MCSSYVSVSVCNKSATVMCSCAVKCQCVCVWRNFNVFACSENFACVRVVRLPYVFVCNETSTYVMRLLRLSYALVTYHALIPTIHN